jgi:hypothetical protein
MAPPLSDVSLKHFTASRSFFIFEREAPATVVSIQVTAHFLSTPDVFPTITRPIAVSTIQFVLSGVRPLPWTSLLDSHLIGDEILLTLCSLCTCFPGADYEKHPWPPPHIMSWMRCLQCMYLQQCHPRDRAKLSGKLFLFTEEDRAKISIHYGLETI